MSRISGEFNIQIPITYEALHEVEVICSRTLFHSTGTLYGLNVEHSTLSNVFSSLG